MSTSALQVQIRSELGKQAVKRMRRQGKVPGVYYFHGKPGLPFQVDAKELRAALLHKSSIIDVSFDGGEVNKCIVREVQWDPVKSMPLHLDLMGVQLTEKVEVEVAVRLVGAALGVKNGGVLQHLLRDVAIKCLPLDIPDAIEVDVANLDIHDALHVGDLKLEKIEILNDPEQVIVSVLPPRLEEAVPTAAPLEEAKEPEVIGHGKKEEEEEEGGESSARK